MEHEQYLEKAFDEAFSGMRSNKGGPFGAVIVLNGTIIGRGCNLVLSTNDPTAHAEIVAIRDACKAVNNFHLDGAILYITCEPCPMCLSAIYWAQIKNIYYCSTKVDADRIGFDDNNIYKELGIQLQGINLKLEQIKSPRAAELFNEWLKKEDKINY
jgi:guanine deaminase